MANDANPGGPAPVRSDPGQPAADIRWDVGFSATLAAFAAVALFVWFPRDIAGGFIVRNAVGKIGPGDAFFPVLLASAILILSLLDLALNGVRSARNVPPASTVGRLTFGNLVFLVRFHAAVLAGLIVMFWLGPALVAVQNELTGGALQYRQLADAVPYKYVGFVAGGLIVTLPTIAWAERRWSVRSALIALFVVVMMIVVFDVLLKNVQLPPNADY